jgi:hypothetical protein
MIFLDGELTAGVNVRMIALQRFKKINNSINIWKSFSSNYNSVLWILNDLSRIRVQQLIPDPNPTLKRRRQN